MHICKVNKLNSKYLVKYLYLSIKYYLYYFYLPLPINATHSHKEYSLNKASIAKGQESLKETTYQRLMDQVCKGLINDIMEVYIDI